MKEPQKHTDKEDKVKAEFKNWKEQDHKSVTCCVAKKYYLTEREFPSQWPNI